MPNGMTPAEASHEEPYTPEPGSILAEAKWVADEEKFLEAVGATDEEEHQKKLHQLEEADYNDAYQEHLRDEFRTYVNGRRIELGQVSPSFVPEPGRLLDAVDLSNMAYERTSEATRKLTLEEWQQPGRYYEVDVNATVAFYAEVFPGLPAYMEQQLKGKAEVSPRDLTRVLDAYLDGEDLPRPTPKAKS